MRRRGLQMPLVVRHDYQLIDGARRLQAAISLGWSEIPVVATSDWNLVRKLLAEANASPWHKTYNTLEHIDLQRRILWPMYRDPLKATVIERRKKGIVEAGPHRAVISMWLSEMLHIPPSLVVSLVNLGSSISAQEARDPVMAADMKAFVRANEGVLGPSAILSRWRRHAIPPVAPPDADEKVAKAQIGLLERVVPLLKELARELGRHTMNPAIGQEEARRWNNQIRHALEDAYKVRVQLREIAATRGGEDSEQDY